MLPEENQRLEWVQKNRARPPHARPVGQVTQRLVERVVDSSLAQAREAASLMRHAVDEEFRCHCRVAVVAGFRVVIHVDDPTMVFAMRQRWCSSLAAVLRQSGWRGRDQRIEFNFGSAGVRVDE